ncbi:hypothetical protein EDD18DRAFT_593900 [Armillaria luteobubalina]|uniref:Uncharacterized protein n=1 Tax=Armillaria luteobubalina TaxID=153913 RepID=A0AA39PQR3_9AGAR|nr:hypothetical protein EDD18DRAFT_593900 [Armillaria luteobubalina]
MQERFLFHERTLSSTCRNQHMFLPKFLLTGDLSCSTHFLLHQILGSVFRRVCHSCAKMSRRHDSFASCIDSGVRISSCINRYIQREIVCSWGYRHNYSIRGGALLDQPVAGLNYNDRTAQGSLQVVTYFNLAWGISFAMGVHQGSLMPTCAGPLIPRLGGGENAKCGRASRNKSSHKFALIFNAYCHCKALMHSVTYQSTARPYLTHSAEWSND